LIEKWKIYTHLLAPEIPHRHQTDRRGLDFDYFAKEVAMILKKYKIAIFG
jgi:hypothetical protein